MDTATQLTLTGGLSRRVGGLLTACIAIGLLGYIYADSLGFLLDQGGIQTIVTGCLSR